MRQERRESARDRRICHVKSGHHHHHQQQQLQHQASWRQRCYDHSYHISLTYTLARVLRRQEFGDANERFDQQPYTNYLPSAFSHSDHNLHGDEHPDWFHGFDARQLTGLAVFFSFFFGGWGGGVFVCCFVCLFVLFLLLLFFNRGESCTCDPPLCKSALTFVFAVIGCIGTSLCTT